MATSVPTRAGRRGFRRVSHRAGVVRFLFGRIQCLFSALGANRQIGEFIGESLGHLFDLLERNGAVQATLERLIIMNSPSILCCNLPRVVNKTTIFG